MVNRNLIRSLDDDEIINELAVLAPEEEADEWLLDWLEQDQQDYAQGEIVDGRIVEVNDEWALIDVGFKSEGTVSLNEWGPEEEKPVVGTTVKVLIEVMEPDSAVGPPWTRVCHHGSSIQGQCRISIV